MDESPTTGLSAQKFEVFSRLDTHKRKLVKRAICEQRAHNLLGRLFNLF